MYQHSTFASKVILKSFNTEVVDDIQIWKKFDCVDDYQRPIDKAHHHSRFNEAHVNPSPLVLDPEGVVGSHADCFAANGQSVDLLEGNRVGLRDETAFDLARDLVPCQYLVPYRNLFDRADVDEDFIPSTVDDEGDEPVVGQMTISVPEAAAQLQYRLRLTYDDNDLWVSDGTGPGSLRVWSRRTNRVQDPIFAAQASTQEARFFPSELSLSVSNLLLHSDSESVSEGQTRRIKLFVEAVKESSAIGDRTILAELLGPDSVVLAEDTVCFTAIHPAVLLSPGQEYSDSGTVIAREYTLDDESVAFEAYVFNLSTGTPVQDGAQLAWSRTSGGSQLSTVSGGSVHWNLGEPNVLGSWRVDAELTSLSLGGQLLPLDLPALQSASLPESAVPNSNYFTESVSATVTEGVPQNWGADAEWLEMQGTFVANGFDRAILTIEPTDRLGNPMPDGTPVLWDLAGPVRRVGHLSDDAISGGSATIIVETDSFPGEVSVIASCGGATYESLVIESRAAQVIMTGTTVVGTVVGSAAATYTATVIDPQTGNPVAAGTPVTFYANNGALLGVGGSRHRMMLVDTDVNGEAHVQLTGVGAEPTSISGEHFITAGVLGNSGDAIAITFEKPPGPAPLYVEMADDTSMPVSQRTGNRLIVPGAEAGDYYAYTAPYDDPLVGDPQTYVKSCSTAIVHGQKETTVTIDVVPKGSNGFPINCGDDPVFPCPSDPLPCSPENLPVFYRGGDLHWPMIPLPRSTPNNVWPSCGETCEDAPPYDINWNGPFVLVTCLDSYKPTWNCGRELGQWTFEEGDGPDSHSFAIEFFGDPWLFTTDGIIQFDIKVKTVQGGSNVFDLFAAFVAVAPELAQRMAENSKFSDTFEGLITGDGTTIHAIGGDILASMLIWGDIRDLAEQIGYCLGDPNGELCEPDVLLFAALGLIPELMPVLGEPVDFAFAVMKRVAKSFGRGSDMPLALFTEIIRRHRTGGNLSEVTDAFLAFDEFPETAKALGRSVDSSDEALRAMKNIKCD